MSVMWSAIARSAYTAALAGASTLVAALLIDDPLRHALLLAAASALAVLGGRGALEGSYDLWRDRRAGAGG